MGFKGNFFKCYKGLTCKGLQYPHIHWAFHQTFRDINSQLADVSFQSSPSF